MTMRPRIDDLQRRARLVERHHLRRDAGDVEAAVRDLVVLHSSDPLTPYLALWARIPGFSVADLERALYADRSLWRLHAMRRTLFVVPTDLQPIMTAACGRGIARTERRKLERWVADALGTADSGPWLRDLEDRTLAALADGQPRRTQELSALVDGPSLRLTLGSGRWVAPTPLASRLLFLLAMEGHLVRAQPAGSWRSSQYHWTDVRTWFFASGHDQAQALDPDEGCAELARVWLRAHGPATTTDLRWWAGWTVKATAAALAATGAVEVDFDGSTPGWVLPDDLDTHLDDPQGVALLPSLDPTIMGWKERDWYLGDHAAQLFDSNGNAGPTVWVDGRVVGAWAHRPGGEVVTHVLEDVGADATALVAAEAAALTDWCNGATTPRFPSPLHRQLTTE